MGIGMPQTLLLTEFGSLVWDAFGDAPYHVGSSMGPSKTFRDVDVRLILEDSEYKRLGLGRPDQAHQNAKWVALCKAFSALGKEMTGYPVDFQIQQQTDANKNYKGKRSFLGFTPHRVWKMDSTPYLRERRTAIEAELVKVVNDKDHKEEALRLAEEFEDVNRIIKSHET